MARRGKDSDRRFGDDPMARRRLRCAVYTRKSSDEGLEQSFNSLHAQRDACEAYVASQKHEGWMLLPQAYDDGAYSGGSMNRPALQRLLDDIRSGLIDIVVVYKVDRLTRSLADFAKLTELFDANGASFVSVTQAFNTSTSMGRLTLNVLLSFAQFEREVAGERIRDKIALSKRRGMWMGGLPPLGYDGIDKKLVVNEPEADTVRQIFHRYLKLGSIAALKQHLDASGVVSKRRRFSDGREVGGVSLSRGALYQILRNRLYRGEIAYRGEVHQGNHEAIVDEDLWSQVQDLLIAQSQRKRSAPQHPDDNGAGQRYREPALLAGLVFDEQGNRLTPTYATKRGRRYRYYVSAPLTRGERNADGIRVPAPDLEALVAETLERYLSDGSWVCEHFGAGLDATQLERLVAAAGNLANRIASPASETEGDVASRSDEGLRSLIARVMVGKQRLALEVDEKCVVEALEEIDRGLVQVDVREEAIPIEVEAHTLRCGKQTRLVVGDVETEHRSPDPKLVKLVADAHRWFDDLRTGRRATIAEIAANANQQVSHVSRTIGLAFLAPDIAKMILMGSQPISLTPERLKANRPLPLEWNEQRVILLP
ncbi:recombinase family protein [Microbaculum marinisediminis]|uniref:Recombinase family protein n=1 Tax=Microbaculum marinisediminis TaxID=2931392 RepID=A0AAW5QYF5_9HYPH|nr:recombinase family protein [Microbaculum sp. A6E488]MCT8971443.1 recombinase family protein [Microbaculum sp. A6E488]